MSWIIFCGSAAGGFIALATFFVVMSLIPRKNSIQKRQIDLVEEQLRVFHQRMHEERRLADSMERLVRILTNTDEPPSIAEYRSGETEEANDKTKPQ
jgi:hypothetical protein